MSYVAYQDRQATRAAAHAAKSERIEFIRKTYMHLGGAILACAGICTVLLNTQFGQNLALSMLRGSWLLVLGLFMVGGWVANRWASSMGAPRKQYMGLALYVVLEAVILLPMLMIAQTYGGEGTIATAGILTGVVFGGLTITAFVSKTDFSFLGRALMIGGFAAMGFIVVALLFGLTLGTFFSGAMVVLAAGYILYYTSNVLRHYPVGAHVAASLALFSAVALLFWYVLQLVMAFSGRD